MGKGCAARMAQDWQGTDMPDTDNGKAMGMDGVAKSSDTAAVMIQSSRYAAHTKHLAIPP